MCEVVMFVEELVVVEIPVREGRREKLARSLEVDAEPARRGWSCPGAQRGESVQACPSGEVGQRRTIELSCMDVPNPIAKYPIFVSAVVELKAMSA